MCNDPSHREWMVPAVHTEGLTVAYSCDSCSGEDVALNPENQDRGDVPHPATLLAREQARAHRLPHHRRQLPPLSRP